MVASEKWIVGTEKWIVLTEGREGFQLAVKLCQHICLVHLCIHAVLKTAKHFYLFCICIIFVCR